jgi:DNA invertase Pin-like site-specific DNA recombinase
LRVSTPQQSEALQREAIQRAAAARGEAIDLWFAEKVGGQARDRPELDSVRALARRGELSALWVFRLDRLARGALFLLNTVQELRQNGCRIVSVSEGIDFEGPWAVPILATLGTCAEIELEALRDRTAAAKRKAERDGKRWGRPRAGTEAQRTGLQLLLDEGMSLREAAETVGLSRSTAQRMIAASGQEKSVARETKKE